MRRIVSTLYLFCISCTFAFGQQQVNRQRTEYFENQLKIVSLLKSKFPDSAYRIAETAAKAAHKEHLSLYQGKFLFAQGAIQFQREKNSDAEKLYESALAIFKAKGDLSGEAKVYSSLGLLSREQNDVPKALSLQNKALEIRLSINDPLVTSSYNNLAAIYYSTANYPKALSLYLQALQVAEKNNDKLVVATLTNNIALIYWKQGRYHEALAYFERCLVFEMENNDYASIAATYNNIAGIKIIQQNDDEALKYAKEAIAYGEKANSNKQLARSYNLLGQLEHQRKDYKSAVSYELTGLEKRRKLGDHSGISRSLIALAESYIALENFAAAEQALLEGLKITSASSLLKEKESCYKLLGNLYNRTGNWEKANAYLLRRDSLKDSLFNESNSKIIFDLQTKYETAKKESRIFLLNKENDIKALQLDNSALEISKNKSLLTAQQQQLKINALELANKDQIVANQKLDADKKAQSIKNLEKQSRIQNLELANKKLELQQRNLWLGSGLIFFLAFSGISFSFYKRKRLKQQHLLQTALYKQQELATKAVFEGEQNERIRIARDLHDGIGQMLSVVKMNVSTLNPGDKVVAGTLGLVDKTIDELRAISHNLIPEALNFGLVAALEDTCSKINETGTTKVTLDLAAELKNHTLTQQHELSIYRIVQEVLHNMTRHANASHIWLAIKISNGGLMIAIADDGDGFDVSKIDASKGIGWKNISARIRLMDGKMNIRSEKSSGTQIHISIPA